MLGALVPYVIFCLCSLIVCRRNLTVINTVKIAAVSILLPCVDFVIGLTHARFTDGAYVTVGFCATLVSALTYLSALVLLCCSLTRTPPRSLGAVTLATLAGAAVLYAAAETVIFAASIYVWEQSVGTLASFICALGVSSTYGIFTRLLFYAPALYASIKLSRES